MTALAIQQRGPTRTHRGDDIAYNPSLPDKFQFVSSTQLKQAGECRRKWYFSAIKKIDVAPTAAMGFGSEVHEILEEYAKTGVLFDPKKSTAHQVAFEALKYLPEWANDWEPEVNLADQAQGPQLYLSGVPFVSYVDLYVPARFEGVGAIVLPEVIDYKTTSSLHWAKTEAQLRTDIQGVAYARWGIQKSHPHLVWGDSKYDLTKYAVRVKFPWLLSKGKTEPRSAVTDYLVSAADLELPWSRFEFDVSQMLDMAWREQRGELQDRDVPANFDSCDKWGGCPHRTRCSKIAKEDLDRQLVQLRTKKENVVTKNLSDLLGLQAKAAPSLEFLAPVSVIEKPGFDLYIDAVPLRGVSQVTLLEDYLKTALAHVLRDWNETKGTELSDTLEIDFGKWKGPLRALLASSPPSGAVVARSVGETTQVALEVLKPLARSVVQGVR